jgi:uncharacterized protein (TIGR03435 family)
MFRTFAAFCATFLFLLMTAGHGDCQSGPASSPVLGFDVASIKPTGSPDVRLRMQFAPGGAFTATAATLLALVRQAYDVEDVQITGARGWMASDRFDVSAKLTDARPGISEQDTRGMLRALLDERFQLKAHRDPKEMTVYVLSVDVTGPKLKPWTGVMARPDVVGAPRGTITLNTTTIDGLAKALTGFMGRPVVDETGMTGRYAIALAFTPELGLAAGGNVYGVPPSAPPGSLDGISVFSALREQLGLRMDSQKRNVEMVVIDSAQKPSAN